MRDCKVTLRGNIAEVSQVSEYINEHSATRLVITLSEELKSTGISYYTLCFKPGAALKNPPNIKVTTDMLNAENGTLTYPLPEALTGFGALDAQVQAHTADESGELISLVKSPVFRLNFEPSITGDEEVILGDASGFIAEIHKALKELNITVDAADELCDRINQAFESGELNGEKGEPGDKGEKGEKGETGAKGDKGDNALINGYNAVTLQGGQNLHLSQNGEVITLNIDNIPVYHTLPEDAEYGDVCLYSPANVLTADDSGKKITIDVEGLLKAQMNEYSVFNFEIIHNSEIVAAIDAWYSELDEMGEPADRRGFSFTAGDNLLLMEFTNGIINSNSHQFIDGIEIPLDESVDYFDLPEFDTVNSTIENFEGDIFHTSFKLMAYRHGWEYLNDISEATGNTHEHDNKKTLDILGCQALDTPLTDGDLNFGIDTEDWHRLKFGGDTILMTSDGAVVKKVEVKESDDGKKFFRLYFNRPGLITNLDIPSFVDIPIDGTNEKFDIGFNGTELVLPSGGTGGVSYDKIELSVTSATLQPNTDYSFGEVAELAITFAEGTPTKRNEYMFSFTSGETATVLTLPSSVQWANELTVEANKRYEISVVDNIGLWCAVEVNV